MHILKTLTTSPWLFIALSAGGLMASMGSANNILVGLQVLAPQSMRATMAAAVLVCVTTLALGIGPPGAAAFSQYIGTAVVNPLGLGLALVAACGGILSGLLYLLALPDVRKFMEAVPQSPVGEGQP